MMFVSPGVSDQTTDDPGASNYSEPWNISVEKNPNLLIIHIVFMVLAWIVLASIATLMARHYRTYVTEMQACGQPIWYQVHRCCMVGVILLTVGGVAAVFAMQGSYVDINSLGGTLTKAHPPLGLAVLCLVVINPFLAIFRPLPDAPGRQLFDWLHWLIGQSAFCVAILNIFLGMNIPRAAHFIPVWLNWVVGAFVIFHITTDIALMAQRMYINSYIKQEETGVLMTAGNSGNPFDEPDPPTYGDTFRKYVMIAYIIVTAGIGFIFIITVTTTLL